MSDILSTQQWFWVAQVFGLVTITYEFISYQIKDKPKYFKYQGMSSLFWFFMFFAMGMSTGMQSQLSLLTASSYSLVRNFVFSEIFKHNTPRSKEIGINFLLFMVVVALVAGSMAVLNAPDVSRWVHALGMLTALIFVVCQYLPGVHYVRISVVFYALAVMLTQTPINILYGDFRWNIMGIAIELSKIAAVVVFYLKSRGEEKKPQLEFERPNFG